MTDFAKGDRVLINDLVDYESHRRYVGQYGTVEGVQPLVGAQRYVNVVIEGAPESLLGFREAELTRPTDLKVGDEVIVRGYDDDPCRDGTLGTVTNVGVLVTRESVSIVLTNVPPGWRTLSNPPTSAAFDPNHLTRTSRPAQPGEIYVCRDTILTTPSVLCEDCAPITRADAVDRLIDDADREVQEILHRLRNRAAEVLEA